VRWNEQKSGRFQALRVVEAHGGLTDLEHTELRLLLDDLDADEADALRPAVEQAEAHARDLAAENARLEAQTNALGRIVADHERLLVDATDYLRKLRERSHALTEEYRRLMGHEPLPAR
jgi:hypothetical protein